MAPSLNRAAQKTILHITDNKLLTLVLKTEIAQS